MGRLYIALFCGLFLSGLSFAPDIQSVGLLFSAKHVSSAQCARRGCINSALGASNGACFWNITSPSAQYFASCSAGSSCLPFCQTNGAASCQNFCAANSGSQCSQDMDCDFLGGYYKCSAGACTPSLLVEQQCLIGASGSGTSSPSLSFMTCSEGTCANPNSALCSATPSLCPATSTKSLCAIPASQPMPGTACGSQLDCARGFYCSPTSNKCVRQLPIGYPSCSATEGPYQCFPGSLCNSSSCTALFSLPVGTANAAAPSLCASGHMTSDGTCIQSAQTDPFRGTLCSSDTDCAGHHMTCGCRQWSPVSLSITSTVTSALGYCDRSISVLDIPEAKQMWDIYVESCHHGWSLGRCAAETGSTQLWLTVKSKLLSIRYLGDGSVLDLPTCASGTVSQYILS